MFGTYRISGETLTEQEKAEIAEGGYNRAKLRQVALHQAGTEDIRRGGDTPRNSMVNYGQKFLKALGPEFKHTIEIGVPQARLPFPSEGHYTKLARAYAEFLHDGEFSKRPAAFEVFMDDQEKPLEVATWAETDVMPRRFPFMPEHQSQLPYQAPVSALITEGCLQAAGVNTITYGLYIQEYTRMTFLYFLNNGTPEGAANRLRSCWEVAMATGYGTGVKVSSLPHQTKEDLDKALGLSADQIINRWEATSLVKELPEFIMDMLSYNRTSTAGAPYPTTIKRRSTIMSDLTAAMTMLEIIAEDETRGEYHRTERLCATIRDNFVVWLKPKFEIAKKDKVFGTGSVSRNIMVTPGFTSILINAFLQDSLRRSKWMPLLSYLGEKDDLDIDESQLLPTNSLAGFNPFNGGLHGLLSVMVKRADEHPLKRFVAGYSDNLFVMRSEPGGHVLESWDGSKMESSARPADGRDAMQLLFRHMEDNGAIISPQMKEFLMTLGADVAIDNTFTVSDITGKFPGLGSGAQTTFWINHFRMMSVVSALKDDPMTDVEAAVKSLPYTPVIMRLEAKSGEKDWVTSYPLAQSLNYVSLDDLMKRSEIAGTLSRYGPLCRLDMLGFDATNIKTDDGTILVLPCLAYKRCYRSFMYCRMLTKDGSNETVRNNVKTLTVLTQLYCVGGYAYPDLTDMMRATAALLVSECINMMTSTKQFQTYEDAIAMGGDLGQTLYRMVEEGAQTVVRDAELGITTAGQLEAEEAVAIEGDLVKAVLDYFRMPVADVLCRQRALEYGAAPSRSTFQNRVYSAVVGGVVAHQNDEMRAPKLAPAPTINKPDSTTVYAQVEPSAKRGPRTEKEPNPRPRYVPRDVSML